MSESIVTLSELTEFLSQKIKEAEKAVDARMEMQRVWKEGDDKSWRAVGFKGSKSERLKLSDSQGRIAEKCRNELAMLTAMLAYLKGTGPK